MKPIEQAAATRKWSRSKKSKVVATAAGDRNAAETETETESGDSSLEGNKFVNLVDLLLPVPIKGENDMNKIKSSPYFYFFS